MIRFLQKDSKAIKIVFWIIILAACISMVVFLVPGILSDQGGVGSNTLGTGGTTIAGTSPDGAKAVTILLFTEGRSIVTLEFDSAANDPVPPDFVTDVGQKQDSAIKSGLPA